MANLKFKKVPIEERHEAQRWEYSKALISNDSRYGEALRSAEVMVRLRCPQTDERSIFNLRTLLVHECEMAQAWRLLWDSKDDPQRATADWIEGSHQSLTDLSKVIGLLREKDKYQGFDLRDVFYESAQIAVSSDEESSRILSDARHIDGGFEVPTGGRVAQTVEIQLLARLFLGQFDEWLTSLEQAIERKHQGFCLGRRIGPMFIDPPISDASLSRMDSTQLAILVLVGRLRKAFTLASNTNATSLPNYQSLAGEMPSRQFAAWSVVHQFVTASFQGAPDLPALKQRWSAATRGRKIHFSSWPQPVIRKAST